MKLVINPFTSVGQLEFGADRELINKYLKSDFKAVFEKTLNSIEFVTDHYNKEGIMLGYFTKNFKLSYVILNDPCEAIFEGKDLLTMNYTECLAFLKKFDEDIKEEEYVGFTSYKYGIAIYAPDGTDNAEYPIECVTVAERGYFK